MSLAPGVRLGPYEIVGLIGAGGMGKVYRARDTRLGRTVAIKLVQDLSADDRARARLVREAQHASALNHPNICTIYEIGEANGQPFIVMEDVEGRHLVVGHDALRVDHGQSALRRSDRVRIELADPARAPTAAAGARLGWVVGDDPALPDEGSGTTIPASLRGTCRARSEQVG